MGARGASPGSPYGTAQPTAPQTRRRTGFPKRVDGQANPDAAWYYPKPSRLARKITDHVAFGNGVRVEGDTEGEASSLLDRLRGRR